MDEIDKIYGVNSWYVLDLYERYQHDPAVVDAATRDIFQRWTPSLETPCRNGSHALPAKETAPAASPVDVLKLSAALHLVQRVRDRGHMTAQLDPLGSEPPGDPGQELATHDLTPEDLKALPASVVGGPLALDAETPGKP